MTTQRSADKSRRREIGYAAAAGAVATVTAIARGLFGADQQTDTAMLYVLGIVLVSMGWGQGPSLAAAVLSVLAFDFFFVPPYLTFAVANLRHVVTFGVMFVVAMVISDLTRRVQAQARLVRERSLQAEREQLRSTLLSSVSHDLRTPLTAMTGAASTLLDDASALDEGTRRELLQSIYDEAQRLNRHVRNLLDMTRLESGAVELRREWQPIEEAVGSALGRLDERSQGRAVRVELPAELPPVHVDAVLMEQVLVNLLENALKYTPMGTPIDVVGRVDRGQVVVEVRDRGPGVPAAEEQLVFEKFHRGAHSGASHGVGLGLAICRVILQAHGGRIWVEQRAGGGATFAFSVPSGEPMPINARGSAQ